VPGRSRAWKGQLVTHLDWSALGDSVRVAIEEKTGTVRSARTIFEGVNSHIALVLDTESGPLFVKGVDADSHLIKPQDREAMIGPYVSPVSPRLRFRVRAGRWDLLIFDALANARTADYSPGSDDLPRVVGVMHRLAAIQCPDLPLKRAEQRWSEHIDDPADCELLRGTQLLHTDFNPLNILINDDGPWIVDWAWPTRGAAFIDPACFLLRMMTHGHSPAEAEQWAARCPGWDEADPHAIDVFASANQRLFREIAEQEKHSEWKADLATAAATWAEHRGLLVT
jgi:hypothetical protein